MPEPFKTQAIVLSSRSLGESDLLISLCTPQGKIKTIAKGAKRSRKRFLNALEPFTYLNAEIVPSRSSSGLARLESAEVKGCFPRLRADISSYAHASLCCELVELWGLEGDPQPEVFNLLLWYLTDLEGGLPARKATLFFKVRLLTLAGFSPDWKACPGCKKRPREGENNALPCPVAAFCSNKEITLGTIRTLEHIQRARLRDLHRLSLNRQVFQQAWELTRELHCRHLHKRPASYKVLTKLAQAET